MADRGPSGFNVPEKGQAGSIVVNKGYRQGFGIAAAMGLLGLLISLPALGVEVHHFANGITANVYSPEEIVAEWTTYEKGTTYLTHPAAGLVELQDNKDVMHPFGAGEVVAALEEMRGFSTRVDVDVFILPSTPAATGSSFARRGAIYLAPGTGPVDPSTLAYITTHEMGHVLTWAFMDAYSARWSAYLDLRGLDRSSLDPVTRHADRAREILAEDIRALFGGVLATRSGSIENHDLDHPDAVEGLADLLAGYFREAPAQPRQLVSTAFPNPCNPMTTIEMVIPAGQVVAGQDGVLRMYDIRGSLVKSISGGQLSNNRLMIRWDGTGPSGEVVSSGRYLYVLQVGQLVSRGSVTLVR